MGSSQTKAPTKSEDDIIKENQLKYLENLEKKRKQERELVEAKKKQEELEIQNKPNNQDANVAMNVPDIEKSEQKLEEVLCKNNKDLIEIPESPENNTSVHNNENKRNSNLNFVNQVLNENLTASNSINNLNELYNSKNQNKIEEPQHELKKDFQPNIDNIEKLEHNLISKILKISFEAKENYFALHNLKAQFESMDKPLLFKVDELDEYMLEIINDPEIKKNIIENFLLFFSRAFTMLEVKHKNDLDEKYSIIRKTISSYLGMIICNPENFGIQINEQILIKNFIDFYYESERDEFDFLINDLVNSLAEDFDGLKKVFSFYIFGIFHDMNLKSECNFYQNDKIKNNLNTIIRMLNDHPVLRKLYTKSPLFRFPLLDGKMYQMNTLLGYYFSLVSFECTNQSLIKSAFSSIGMREAEVQLRSQQNKMNNLMTLLCNLLDLLIKDNEASIETFNFIFDIINKNYDRQKTYFNQYTTSTNGFLLNLSQGLLRLLFEKFTPKEDEDYSFTGQRLNIFHLVKEIDISYGAISKQEINLQRFERINYSLANDYLKNQTEKINLKEDFNRITKLFFSIHVILSYFLKNLETEYTNVLNQLSKMFGMQMYNDPKSLETFAYYRSIDVYLKSPELTKYMVAFAQMSCVLIINLNNKKYNTRNNMNFSEIEIFGFNDDFYMSMEKTDILELSILPNFIVKNILMIVSLLRKSYPDVFVDQMNMARTIIYFALIYSSETDMIQNPHLRSELLEIIMGLLIISPEEKKMNGKIIGITKLLNDNFITENLISSLFQIFIDAERLGTQNQFFEKFNIRHKILYLIENIMKTHESLYLDQIREYAINKTPEATKMINNLMNDLTYLIDECIEKLSQIKTYQELLDDKEKFNKLDEETKQLENEKFTNNDRIVKGELQLLNSSFKFLALISENCQNTFMNLRLFERLANFMNYSFDVFTSTKGLKIKIKNMGEYGFDPKFILTSLVTIYSSFVDYGGFIEYVVKDQRAFKLENFEKVFDLKDRNKIHIGYPHYSNFTKFYELAKQAFEDFKEKCIDYDDAPEEFLDSLTSELMENPVMLPDSKMILDRVTIETHLLSDLTDPFNRSKLTKDMLIDCPDLKQKIEDYKNTKIKNKSKLTKI